MEFSHAESLREVLETLEQKGYEAKVVAGGISVVLLLQLKLIAPELLVSLERVPDLDDIRVEDDGLHIGPLAHLRHIEFSSLVREYAPALAAACGEVGNVRVRNQGTLGGNLAHADYASDPPAMLLALDASVTLSSAKGERSVPLSEFFYGFYSTALEDDELITDVVVPTLPANARMTYLKFKSRSSEDRPCVSVAAVAGFDGDTCSDLRLAVGAASDIPVRLDETNNMAKDQELTDELITEIAEQYATNIDAIDDLRGTAWYRRQMVRVHVRDALREVRNGSR